MKRTIESVNREQSHALKSQPRVITVIDLTGPTGSRDNPILLDSIEECPDAPKIKKHKSVLFPESIEEFSELSGPLEDYQAFRAPGDDDSYRPSGSLTDDYSLSTHFSVCSEVMSYE
jgi:hypothetical protein